MVILLRCRVFNFTCYFMLWMKNSHLFGLQLIGQMNGKKKERKWYTLEYNNPSRTSILSTIGKNTFVSKWLLISLEFPIFLSPNFIFCFKRKARGCFQQVSPVYLYPRGRDLNASRAVLLLLKSCCMADVDSTNSPSGLNLFCYSLDPLSILFISYAADVRFNHLSFSLFPVSRNVGKPAGKRNNRGKKEYRPAKWVLSFTKEVGEVLY